MSLESPNWLDTEDRELYFSLAGKENLTKEQKEFVAKMYHLEEFANGLDG